MNRFVFLVSVVFQAEFMASFQTDPSQSSLSLSLSGRLRAL